MKCIEAEGLQASSATHALVNVLSLSVQHRGVSVIGEKKHFCANGKRSSAHKGTQAVPVATKISKQGGILI